MAKQLRISYKGKEYTLEFTRKTVSEMERNGFIAGDIDQKPASTIPVFFAGAFLAHHRYERKEVIGEIFEKMTNRKELISALAEMYNEPIMALVDEPEESEGNASWTTI